MQMKKKKSAAEEFCDDLRRRKSYTADWLASQWGWSGVSNISSDTGEQARLLNKKCCLFYNQQL